MFFCFSAVEEEGSYLIVRIILCCFLLTMQPTGQLSRAFGLLQWMHDSNTHVHGCTMCFVCLTWDCVPVVPTQINSGGWQRCSARPNMYNTSACHGWHVPEKNMDGSGGRIELGLEWNPSMLNVTCGYSDSFTFIHFLFTKIDM